MLTATLRGLIAHRLRLGLTMTAVALGVAFLAGTLILTDTIKLAFDQLFGKVSSGVDSVVREKSAYDQSVGVALERPPITAAVLPAVQAVPGVAVAEGRVSGYALLTDTHGRAVTAAGGAPTQGYSLPQDQELRGDVHLRTGRAPTSATDVAIDATSAEKHDIPLGSTIRVLFRDSTREFTVVGTIGYGGEKDLGGTTAAYFDIATAQKVLGTAGKYDEIDVRAVDGVSADTLSKRLDATLPSGAEAVTGSQVAKESSDSIKKQFKFLNVMFGIFAGIALFVGSFIIWNTFTMTVTQRSREIALLRAVGATRGQVLRSLLGEAALLGVVASAIGIGAGVVVAMGLKLLMDAIGFSLPSTSLQLHARTVWLSLLVGTLVTVVAAIVPSRRATRVAPVEALRDAAPTGVRSTRRRAVIGAVMCAVAVAAVLSGLYGGSGGNIVLLGLLLAVVGFITMAPAVVRPLAGVMRRPLLLRGLPGELAHDNAVRNPRRTASTASALMIGLTLVISMGVFAASLKASFGTILSTSTSADLYIASSSTQAEGFSPQVTRVVAAVPGVAVASATSFGEARFAGSSTTYSSVDPTTVDRVLDLQTTSGSASALGDDGVLVHTSVAKSHHWSVGSRVPVEFASTGKRALMVRGIFDDKSYLNANYIISLATQDATSKDRLDSAALVKLESGVSQSEAKAAIATALAQHPDAQVLDKKGYEKQISGFVDKLLAFVSVMLLLAVLIALLGIVNTLALSVFERTRELGLLRAVGMTRKQVRSMVRWESVVISLIGALVGAFLGVLVGTSLAQSLKGDGITEVAVPVLQVLAYIVAAAIAGVVAALGPARSASRVDVLRAVVSD